MTFRRLSVLAENMVATEEDAFPVEVPLAPVVIGPLNTRDHSHMLHYLITMEDQADSLGDRIKNFPFLTQNIGRRFDVVVAARGSVVESVAIQTVIPSIHGYLRQIEDICTREPYRGRGNAPGLLKHIFLEDFQAGCNLANAHVIRGITWEVREEFSAAHRLYHKFDPGFAEAIQKAPKVWKIDHENLVVLQKQPSANGAHLAVNEDGNLIFSTLKHQPAVHVPFVTGLIARQTREGRSPNSKAFILCADHGSIAVVSEQVSTFDGMPRMGMQICLPSSLQASAFTAPVSLKQAIENDVAALIKRAARETFGASRREPAEMQIEFAESRPLKIRWAENVFREVLSNGEPLGHPLIHKQSFMKARTLVGRDYIRAVVWAAEHSSRSVLSPQAEERLQREAASYKIGYHPRLSQ